MSYAAYFWMARGSRLGYKRSQEVDIKTYKTENTVNQSPILLLQLPTTYFAISETVIHVEVGCFCRSKAAASCTDD